MPDYQPRNYRSACVTAGLSSFRVVLEESDLRITAQRDLSGETLRELTDRRAALKTYLRYHPEFGTSFSPVAADSPEEIIRLMSESSFLTGTGPMASVAGAVAETIGKKLLPLSSRLIIENGGDIFLHNDRETTIAVFAGNSPFSLHIGIKVAPSEHPRGIATSSGTVGHSFSYGKADAVTVLSRSAALSDGAATHFGNRVKSPDDLKTLPEEIKTLPFVEGLLVVIGKELFVWGTIELVSL